MKTLLRWLFVFTLLSIPCLMYFHGFSIDAAVQRLRGVAPGETKDPVLTLGPGQDWVDIEGIRWFKILGTDSSGMGYSGWVSELAIKKAPPLYLGSSAELITHLGFPSSKERARNAKALRKLLEDMERAVHSK